MFFFYWEVMNQDHFFFVVYNVKCMLSFEHGFGRGNGPLKALKRIHSQI